MVGVAEVGVLPAGLRPQRRELRVCERAEEGDRAAGIAISTLGFLSQSMLTAPRVYYAMAKDGVFFPAVGRVSEATRVPVVAIVLQGVVAIAITLSGTYEQILSYVVSVDFVFFGLTGAALFIFRRRHGPGEFRTPGHPVTTAIFTLACWAVVVATVVHAPRDSAIGYGILAAGLVVYAIWARQKAEGRRQNKQKQKAEIKKQKS